MNIGIDVGNGYVKYNGGKFASKVKIGELLKIGKKKNEVHEVKFNETTYIVGEGAVFTGDNRYFSEYYKVSLLTAIALSTKEDFIQCNICVGLPFNKFRTYGEKLQKHIKDISQTEITVNGTVKNIRITNSLVFIEGAYPILEGIEENVIVIDMGAGTINVSEWEDMSVINSDTYSESMNKMYSDIAKYLNSTKNTDYKPSEIEKILNKKEIVINGEKVDITDIRNIIKNNIVEVASYIKTDFNYKNVDKIFLIGGGAADTVQYWKEQFKNIELVKDSQYMNQRLYDSIAKEEFGEEEESAGKES